MASGKILYYAVGPVHPRNLGLIAAAMADWEFCMIYEPEAWWMDAASLAALPFDKVAFANGEVPRELNPGVFAAVVFSAVQPRPAPVHLLMWAIDNGLPAIAIEESNQLALNDGAVNNYLLPVDHLLVASPEEGRGFVAAGVPERRVQVTGWPFYPGHEVLDPVERACAKRELGLDLDLRVATLTLTGFNDTSGETPSVRRALMTMAAIGLPAGFQLAIKPHPIEDMAVLMPFVEECAPAAVVIEGAVKIDKVLDATDVLLNRGVSQVAVEALTREIPVVVLSAGRVTPFHRLAPDVVAEDREGVAQVIAKLSETATPMDFYAAYRREHMPYVPAEARGRTCEQIADIALRRRCDPDPAAQRIDLSLYAGWKVDRRAAEAWLRAGDTDARAGEADALARLLFARAGDEDLELLRRYCAGPYAGQVLRCLWLDQLADQRRATVTARDREWMADFPPPVNVNLFVGHCAAWWRLLRRAGWGSAAAEFAGKLGREWGRIPEYGDLIEEMALWEAGARGRAIIAARHLLNLAERAGRKFKRIWIK